MATEKRLEDQFVENVSRYPFYFFSVLLGAIWELLMKPVVTLYRTNRFAAVAVVLGVIGVFVFLYATLSAMMGKPVFV